MSLPSYFSRAAAASPGRWNVITAIPFERPCVLYITKHSFKGPMDFLNSSYEQWLVVCAFQVDVGITTHFDFCFSNIYREPAEQNLASSFFLLVLALPPCRWYISSLVSEKIPLCAMVRSDTCLRTVSCRHGIQKSSDRLIAN